MFLRDSKNTSNDNRQVIYDAPQFYRADPVPPGRCGIPEALLFTIIEKCIVSFTRGNNIQSVDDYK